MDDYLSKEYLPEDYLPSVREPVPTIVTRTPTGVESSAPVASLAQFVGSVAAPVQGKLNEVRLWGERTFHRVQIAADYNKVALVGLLVAAGAFLYLRGNYMARYRIKRTLRSIGRKFKSIPERL